MNECIARCGCGQLIEGETDGRAVYSDHAGECPAFEATVLWAGRTNAYGRRIDRRGMNARLTPARQELLAHATNIAAIARIWAIPEGTLRDWRARLREAVLH